MIDGSRVVDGDIVLGFGFEWGPFERVLTGPPRSRPSGAQLDAPAPFDSRQSLGEALLAATRIYVNRSRRDRRRRRSRNCAYHRWRTRREHTTRGPGRSECGLNLGAWPSAGIRLDRRDRRGPYGRHAPNIQPRDWYGADRRSGHRNLLYPLFVTQAKRSTRSDRSRHVAMVPILSGRLTMGAHLKLAVLISGAAATSGIDRHGDRGLPAEIVRVISNEPMPAVSKGPQPPASPPCVAPGLSNRESFESSLSEKFGSGAELVVLRVSCGC